MNITDYGDYAWKIFGGAIPPTNLMSQFGSLKNGVINYSNDPTTIQSLPAFVDGWASAVINSYYPAHQDMNSLYYLLSRQLAYFRQSGIPEWKSDIEYFINAIVSDALGSVYKSLVNNNLNQPFTDATKWFLLHSNKITQMVNFYHATNLDYNIHSSLENCEHVELYLPNPTASLSGRRYFVLITGLFTNVVYVYQETITNTFNTKPGVTNILITKDYLTYPNYCEFMCDGLTWWALNDSTSFHP